MKKELMEMRKYIVVVLIGVFSFWALNNFNIIFEFLKNIFSVLIPFILGGVIAFILNIPMRKIENVLKKKFKFKSNSVRGVSILLSILIFIAIILFVALLLIPELVENIKMLIDAIPGLIDKIELFFINLLDKYPDVQLKIEEMFNGSGNVTSIISNILNYIVNSGVGFITSLISSFITIFTAIIFSIYMLVQKEELISGGKKIVYAILDKEDSDKTVEICKMANNIFSKFLSGQCLDACILGGIMFVVLTIFGFPYALLISVLTTITALIPIFGALIAMAIGAILIAITSPFEAIMFILAFLIVQQIEGNFIYPKVVGKSVGLSPLWTLLAITVGGDLFGVVGMLIGLPLASVVYSIFKTSVNNKLKEKEIKVS